MLDNPSPRERRTVLVVSDACDDRNCVAVACERPRPTCRASGAPRRLERRTTAKYRCMDDTFVDVDVAWHLAAYDGKPYYVEVWPTYVTDTQEESGASPGAARWVSKPAAELTENHLTSTTFWRRHGLPGSNMSRNVLYGAL